jgi:glyceraldehyde-3-phosphate dehydrogenase/erythrose-4-phosphate dehydrogenase
VSTDVLHNTYSSVFDAGLTMVLGEKSNFVKVFAGMITSGALATVWLTS